MSRNTTLLQYLDPNSEAARECAAEIAVYVVGLDPALGYDWDANMILCGTCWLFRDPRITDCPCRASRVAEIYARLEPWGA